MLVSSILGNLLVTPRRVTRINSQHKFSFFFGLNQVLRCFYIVVFCVDCVTKFSAKEVWDNLQTQQTWPKQQIRLVSEIAIRIWHKSLGVRKLLPGNSFPRMPDTMGATGPPGHRALRQWNYHQSWPLFLLQLLLPPQPRRNQPLDTPISTAVHWSI